MKKIFFLIALFAIIFSTELYAQHAHEASKKDDGHGHKAEELPEIKFTKIVSGYEVYISMHTLIEGTDVHFHLNLTDISTYKPVDGAKATVTIGEFTTAQKTSKGGVCHYGFKPKQHGEQKISAQVEIAGEVIDFDLGTLTIFHSISEAAHAPVEENIDEINLSKDWTWTHDFGVEIVQLAPFNEVIRTRGEILPSTSSKSVIIAPTAGIITFAKNLIIGKKLVTKEAIGYIKGSGLEDNIESRLNKLKAEYDGAKSNYERNKILFKDFIVSEKDLADSYNFYVASREDYKSLSKIYSSNGVKVMASSAAVITDILVSENQYVAAGTIIATVNLNQENMLKADVSKYNYSKISNIIDANFIPEYSSKSYNVAELGGMRLVNSIATRENSAYIPVYFSLPKSSVIVPYSYAEVFLIIGSIESVISVPNSAISENEGLYWVYIQTNGEAFEKRDIILGGADGERKVVLEGLNVGDIVVTNGSAKVRQSETSGAEIPHGHAH